MERILQRASNKLVFLFFNQIMRMSLAEISENTKTGRESALLGDYETSMVYYQGVIQQIQRLLATVKDNEKKRLWNQVFYFITSVIYLILHF